MCVNIGRRRETTLATKPEIEVAEDSQDPATVAVKTFAEAGSKAGGSPSV